MKIMKIMKLLLLIQLLITLFLKLSLTLSKVPLIICKYKLILHQTKAADEFDLIYCRQVNLQIAINKRVYLKKGAKLEAI